MRQELSKTEVLPIKSEMRDIEIGGTTMKPKLGVKILGIYLQANGKFGMEVEEREKKLRKNAAWIRTMWYLRVSQRIIVYKAIIHGTIFSNARIYLPEITAKQEKSCKLQ